MSKKLKNQVAIVTGSSKGIGASIAKHLAEEGASVVVNYATSKEGAERVVSEISQKGGKAVALQADLSKPADIQRLFVETKKTFGRIDILVNNAGVYEFKQLEEITSEHFHKLFNLNVLGLVLATQEAVKYFGDKGGCVVNISSVAATSALPSTSIYSATKAAVDTITKSLAKELGPRGIRVNSINPGMVETEGLHNMGFADGELGRQIVKETPLGRIGQPQDIAPAVIFFCTPDSGWITGETLYVSGGKR